MDAFETIETIILVCGSSAAVCIMAVFGGAIVYIVYLGNRSIRKAAQSWHSTQGRVIDTRVVPRVYFWGGITEAEAEAQVKKWKEEEKLRPADLPAAILSMFGPVGEFAGDLVSTPRGGPQSELEEWPMVTYEYEIDGVKYVSNRVRVEDVSGPTTGGGWYTKQLFKRYPKGSTVTVYYNPKNPKESALER
ncbi:MAG: DUF3592 domain-containing protein [Chloroflexota bacterium]